MDKKSFELEERTAVFSESVIDYCRHLGPNYLIRPVASQLLRSATSIGANYREANAASSQRDFRNKIFIARKEAQETEYWIRMSVKASPNHREAAVCLWKECQELCLIFGKISSSLGKR
tara:strand:- start:124 stop:480 length:357 start_codon:yes stop_codon:yes gene_type:complete